MDEPIRRRTENDPPASRPDRTTPDGRVYRWDEVKQEWRQHMRSIAPRRPGVVTEYDKHREVAIYMCERAK